MDEIMKKDECVCVSTSQATSTMATLQTIDQSWSTDVDGRRYVRGRKINS